jgi:lysine-N-methylase
VRDNIVCFSRIIGYNTDGMKEFWEESFDDAIWELGYLILLVS